MSLDSDLSVPDPSGHIPVLVDAVMERLQVKAGGTYVDCTAGGGGHTVCIAEAMEGGCLVALDRDPMSVETVRKRLEGYTTETQRTQREGTRKLGFPKVNVLYRNYGELAMVLGELGIERVDGVLLDAGLSSMQLDDPVRGFSFQEDGPLDMRMDPSSGGMTAGDYLADVSEGELARVLKLYGDVGPARRVAGAIVRRRGGGGLSTTGDLAAAVCEGFDFVSGRPDELRTIFQAVRIAVNDEFRWLESGLLQAIDALRSGGRLVVISFHSGEDRIVKNVLRDAARVGRELFPDGRVRREWPPRVRILTRKPVQPGAEEMRLNPRSRSARLRAAEKN